MKKGIAAPLILVAVVLAAIIGGTVVAWRTTYLDPILPSTVREFLGRGGAVPSSESSAETPSETSSEESEPTAEDPTKDWKSYTNSKYGFSFKYPKDWLLYPNVTGGVVGNLGEFIVDLAASQKIGGELVYPTSPVLLRIVYVTSGYVGDGFKPYENAEAYVCRSGFSGCIESLRTKSFGGKTWIEEEIGPEYAPLLYTKSSHGSIYAIYMPKDLAEGYLPTVELVVSTVKFL